MSNIESAFPLLKVDGYKVTSSKNKDYNCIAWAAGISDAWWDPAPGYMWPPGAPREYTMQALILAYQAIGFVICKGDKLDPGFDKIAVYGDAAGWTHAARQLPSGKWTSKLGQSEDIEHNTPEGVVSMAYGSVVSIMKRRRS